MRVKRINHMTFRNLQIQIQIQIQELKSSDLSTFIDIAELLPEWFTSSGIELMQKDLTLFETLVATSHDSVIGFINYEMDNKTSSIKWMAIHPQYHRSGIGTQLLNELKWKISLKTGQFNINITRPVN